LKLENEVFYCHAQLFLILLQGLILSNALRAQKNAEDESYTMALNNLRSEVIELRNEGLGKNKILISLVLGVCFVAEGPIRINTFRRSTQKQSRSCQSKSFVAYYQMYRLKDEMTNRSMIACVMIIIICKGHECNFSQAASCAYK
jgi:hypothetical protein